jgi:hypothetical protein
LVFLIHTLHIFFTFSLFQAGKRMTLDFHQAVLNHSSNCATSKGDKVTRRCCVEQTTLWRHWCLTSFITSTATSSAPLTFHGLGVISRTVQLKCDGTRWRMGGEVKRKLAHEVVSQYPSHYLGTWCIQHCYSWCPHLGWPVVDWTNPPLPRRFKWTRPFRRKTKSGFCVCAITFQTQSNFCNWQQSTPCGRALEKLTFPC